MKKHWKKAWILLLLALAAALTLTGCASGAATQSPAPDTSPTGDPNSFGVTATNQPEQTLNGTAAPGGSEAPTANGGATLESAQKAAKEMESAVERLSEVDEAYVVPLGDTALVGIKFTREYQGQADDRLKKMVLTRLQTVDKTVTRVAVTDNEALADGILALTKALEGASSLDDVNSKAEEILRQLTVYTL